MDALIGYTGFVGSSLLRQRTFDKCYRSTDVQDIHGQKFDVVVCAGAPAKKWVADRDPEADWANIRLLAENLDRIGSVGKFVLISTVDVYPTPVDVNEETPIEPGRATPYGRNRRRLEEFVLSRFEGAVVVRLPGLVGPGLRKNIVFDFLNNNNLSAIDSRGVFQFYPMVNLWSDLTIVLERDLKVVNFSAEPISVRDVARSGFNIEFLQEAAGTTPARYDMHSLYSEYFGKCGSYLYDRRAAILAIRAYAQSEQRTAPAS